MPAGWSARRWLRPEAKPASARHEPYGGVGELAQLARQEVGDPLADLHRVVADPLEAARGQHGAWAALVLGGAARRAGSRARGPVSSSTSSSSRGSEVARSRSRSAKASSATRTISEARPPAVFSDLEDRPRRRRGRRSARTSARRAARCGSSAPGAGSRAARSARSAGRSRPAPGGRAASSTWRSVSRKRASTSRSSAGDVLDQVVVDLLEGDDGGAHGLDDDRAGLLDVGLERVEPGVELGSHPNRPVT